MAFDKGFSTNATYSMSYNVVLFLVCAASAKIIRAKYFPEQFFNVGAIVITDCTRTRFSSFIVVASLWHLSFGMY